MSAHPSPADEQSAPSVRMPQAKLASTPVQFGLEPAKPTSRAASPTKDGKSRKKPRVEDDSTPSPAPLRVLTKARVEMTSAPDLDAKGDDLIMQIGTPEEGTTESIPFEVYRRMAAMISHQIEMQLNPRNFVMGIFHVANPALDAYPLLLSVQRAQKGGREPSLTTIYSGGTEYRFWEHVEAQPTRAPTLVDQSGIQSRSAGNRSFAMFAPVRELWPPPISIGPRVGDNIALAVELDDDVNERDCLAAMSSILARRYCGFFFAAVCPHPITSLVGT